MRCSVVIPTCGRTSLLDRCLAAVTPQGAEVIVVDDGAATDTEMHVLRWGPMTRYIRMRPAGRGPAAARNAGWRAARADIIAFTDDDTVPENDWVARGTTALATAEAVAASGRIVVPLPPRPSDYARDAARLENAGFVTANCFVRRHALEELGGFDETFTAAWREDSDLFFRLLKGGYRVVPAPDAVVVHPVRPAPWGVSLAQQRKTAFDALLYKKHPAHYRQYVRPPLPRVFYVHVAALAFALLGSWVGAAVWLALTALFSGRRLRGTSRTLRHVLEVGVTSMLIPPLSVFWRLYGAVRFRVVYW